jgi:hypothetical protein
MGRDSVIGCPSRQPRLFVAIFRTLQDRADRWSSVVRALAPRRWSPKVLCGRAGTIAHASFLRAVGEGRSREGVQTLHVFLWRAQQLGVNNSISPAVLLQFSCPGSKLAHWVTKYYLVTSKPSRRSPFPPIPTIRQGPHRMDPSPTLINAPSRATHDMPSDQPCSPATNHEVCLTRRDPVSPHSTPLASLV